MTSSTFDKVTSVEIAVSRVAAHIRELERRYQRPPGSVQLLAVSKTKPVEQIQAALTAGQMAFGENYLEEALEKIEALSGTDCQWHFIGAVQSRKTAAIAAHFDWVHSVDRLKIATRLANHRPTDFHPLNVCIQVNLDGETSKAGISPADVHGLAEACAELPALRLRGLMAIPAPREQFDEQRAIFAQLRQLLVELQQKHPTLDTLSMGMSRDLAAAIAEGATIVRVGTAIFGTRG